MSESLPPPAEAPDTAAEPQYGDPISKSESSAPNALGGEAAPEPEAPAAEAPKPDEAKPEDKPAPKKDWRDDRLRQQTARIAAEAKRADDLARRLEALEAKQPKPDPTEAPPAAAPRTEQDFQRAVQQEATRVAEQQAFVSECNKVAEAGTKEFNDFHPTLKTLWDATDGLDANGGMTPIAVALVEAAMETDKPHAVLYHLGQNPDEAIRIAAMKSDAKRGAALAKVAAALSAPPAPKPVSKAPAPIEPVSGAARAEVGPQGPKEIGAWMKWEEARVKALGAKR